MQKWDYDWEFAATAPDLHSLIETAGDRGWELVSVVFDPSDDNHPWVAFLKRPA